MSVRTTYMAMFQSPHLAVGAVKLKAQYQPAENGES